MQPFPVCAAVRPRASIAWNWRDSTAARDQSALRNWCLVAGNLLWVAYGVAKIAPAIIAMCSIGAILNATVALQVKRARRTSALPCAQQLGLKGEDVSSNKVKL